MKPKLILQTLLAIALPLLFVLAAGAKSKQNPTQRGPASPDSDYDETEYPIATPTELTAFVKDKLSGNFTRFKDNCKSLQSDETIKIAGKDGEELKKLCYAAENRFNSDRTEVFKGVYTVTRAPSWKGLDGKKGRLLLHKLTLVNCNESGAMEQMKMRLETFKAENTEFEVKTECDSAHDFTIISWVSKESTQRQNHSKSNAHRPSKAKSEESPD